MRKVLTEKLLLSLKPGTKRIEVRDAALPGFGARLFPSGALSFFVTYRYGKQQRRMQLGRYPIVNLDAARTRALEALRHVDQGIDPARIVVPRSSLVRDVIADFITLYAKRKTRTWKGTEALLGREFAALYGDRDIRQVRRADMIAMLDGLIARDAPTQANRLLAAVRKLFNWCLERDIVEVNPVMGVKPPSIEVTRERVLTDEEITRLVSACGRLGYPFGDLFLMMLLTAQRRGEVSAMRWSEIDLGERVWRMPAARTKNGHAHSVPLCDKMIAILSGVPRLHGSEYVFTTTGRSPVSGWGKTKERLSVLADVHDWRLHDLRRTAASGMARLHVAPYVVEKLLNHVSGTISGVAAVYNRYGYDVEKREALERWEAFIDGLR